MSKQPNRGPIVNALSFDIEDWFHLVEIDAVADPATWDSLPTIVEDKTHWILDTLARYDARGTFFFLGWIAQRYPHLVRRAAEEGHEIATHSYWHRKVYDLTELQFREDVTRSVDVLEQITGLKIRGFRAPSFSIIPGSEWAFDVLLECGLEYDASLFPARRGHGGYPCSREAHWIERKRGRLRELPISVLGMGPVRLPFSGGGYLRALPHWLIRTGFKSLNRIAMPVVVYLHPRDFAPESPRIPMPIRRRVKVYTGLATSARKLEGILSEFKFDTCEKVLLQQLPAGSAE